MAALFARVRAEQGRLDVLVNNAFLIPKELTSGRPFWETPLSNWDDMLDVGTRSAYVASHCAAPIFVAQKAGLIVNVSSSGAAEYAWHVAYGVGKAALDRLTADAARELRPFGVAVVSLWPGLVLTERTSRAPRSAAFPRLQRRRVPALHGARRGRPGRRPGGAGAERSRLVLAGAGGRLRLPRSRRGLPAGPLHDRAGK